MLGRYTMTAVDFYELVFEKLIKEHAEWSQATFRKDNERGPIGPLKHLEKEVKETIEAWQDNGKIHVSMEKVYTEFADCFLLLLDASRRAGMSFSQLVGHAYNKLQVCKTRSYPMPGIGDDNPSEHDRTLEMIATDDGMPARD